MAESLKPVEHDIGGLIVKRLLPNQVKRMVGPFIFFDHMGPGSFDVGEGINVRPHPHIGLSTLTYLFEGSILHKDSLGNQCEIFPGDVNWMTAGKGIVHSERETFEVRANPHSINGLQCWVALPEEYAEIEPDFHHISKHDLPQVIEEDVMMRVVVGEAFGRSSPVKTYWPMFYVDVVAKQGSEVMRPNPDQEAAIYVIYGEIEVGADTYRENQFVLLNPSDKAIACKGNCRFILLGGKAFERTPFIYWNFVSFSKERIEKAKTDWAQGKFPPIPGDHEEAIPLPTK